MTKLKDRVDSTNQLDDYYTIIEIGQGDTISIQRSFTIQKIEDNLFTLHILFLYQNDLGQYFDTYYWCRFKCKEIILEQRIIPEKNIVITKASKKDFLNLIKFVDQNNVSDIYIKRKKKKSTKFLRILLVLKNKIF